MALTSFRPSSNLFRFHFVLHRSHPWLTNLRLSNISLKSSSFFALCTTRSSVSLCALLRIASCISSRFLCKTCLQRSKYLLITLSSYCCEARCRSSESSQSPYGQGGKSDFHALTFFSSDTINPPSHHSHQNHLPSQPPHLCPISPLCKDLRPNISFPISCRVI